MRRIVGGLGCLATAVLFLCACVSTREPRGKAARIDEDGRGLAYFLGWLTDLDRLAWQKQGIRALQFSSYDRASRWDPDTGLYHDWDANADAGHTLRIDASTGEAVLAEMEGPGCIWRIWSANPSGRIRFYLDGAETPTLDLDFEGMFRGEGFPFPPPLRWQRSHDLGGDNSASVSTVPIPFARSCKVTVEPPDRLDEPGLYYHVGYSLFPKSWDVRSFALPLSEAEREAIARTVETLSRCGTDPGEPTGPVDVVRDTIVVEPGQTAHLLDVSDGPGVVRTFRAKLESSERWARRKTVLRMEWDDEDRPSVEAPIGDFFGDPWQEAPYRSLPLGIQDDLNYCYFRMPFRRAAHISVTNDGSLPATLRYEIAVERRVLPPFAQHFHARWRRDRTSEDFDFRLLDASGAGRLVGVALFPDNLVGQWWGEGDEKLYVDGEPFPSTFGTGSEDYFGDAWGIRHFVNPFHGCPTPVSKEAARRQSCYRWHISDSVEFRRSLCATIENYAALLPDPIKNDTSSVTYWYQEPGGTDSFRSATVEERLPQGHVVKGALEVEGLVEGELPAGVAIVGDELLPRELSGGQGLAVEGPAGVSVTLRVPAPADGEYTVEVGTAREIAGAPFEILKDGRPFGYRVALSEGENDIAVRLRGPEDGRVVLDYVLLHPYGNTVREWWFIGPFPNEQDAGLDRAYGPEVDLMPLDPAKISAAYRGKSGPVRWRRIVAPSGIVDGVALLDDPENLVAYAYCEVQSPDDRDAIALLGSDDGVKLWINDTLVHRKHEHRVVTPDEDRVPIRLRAGRNAVLLKVDQGGGPWGFCFRIEDPDGELRYVLPE